MKNKIIKIMIIACIAIPSITHSAFHMITAGGGAAAQRKKSEPLCFTLPESSHKNNLLWENGTQIPLDFSGKVRQHTDGSFSQCKQPELSNSGLICCMGGCCLLAIFAASNKQPHYPAALNKKRR